MVTTTPGGADTVPVVPRPRSRPPSPDPYEVLGIGRDADLDTIRAARRELAKQAHPDAGGSLEAMQVLNEAAQAATDALAGGTEVGESARSQPTDTPRPRRHRRPLHGAVRHDHPSFTVEVLPAEAFEGALLAAATLGDVLDDDPPYLLEVAMTGRPPAWCRLELVPDAGATTVSLTTARLPGHPTPDVLEVRDRWIDALNRLDWSDLAPPPPS